MNDEMLLRAIGNIDGKYIREAAPPEKTNEQVKLAPRRFSPWKLIPIAAAVTAVVLVAVMVINIGTVNPPVNPELPLILVDLGNITDAGLGGMGWGAIANKSADEMHRDSPAYGREGELETMPVYRNPIPIYETIPELPANLLTESDAIAIAEQFSKAMGRAYVYALAELPPELLEKEKQLEDVEIDPVNEAYDKIFQLWEFKCGDETLRVGAYGRVTLTIPLPATLPQIADPAARHEAICSQAYESYAAAIEALTGLHFNKVSTALEHLPNAEIQNNIETFFYVNNPADSLSQQAEDYALKRLDVALFEFEEPGLAQLAFNLRRPGVEDLVGNYPVLDLEGAKRELLAGHYESSVIPTAEALSRATVEEAELVYSNDPRISIFMPVYRLTLSFQLGDMDGDDDPQLTAQGLRNYYVFYVPAVSAEYLTTQAEDSGASKPAS